MSVIQLLAFVENLITIANPYWEDAKQMLREWLGPVPHTYHLLADGRVLRHDVSLPEEIRALAYMFNPLTRKMSKLVPSGEDGRYKALPFIGIVINGPDRIDISDWLGEIRSYPIPDITPKQIVLLWSLVHNNYIPSENATLDIVKNDGSQETIPL